MLSKIPPYGYYAPAGAYEVSRHRLHTKEQVAELARSWEKRPNTIISCPNENLADGSLPRTHSQFRKADSSEAITDSGPRVQRAGCYK